MYLIHIDAIYNGVASLSPFGIYIMAVRGVFKSFDNIYYGATLYPKINVAYLL
jgi:hypothetical protein